VPASQGKGRAFPSWAVGRNQGGREKKERFVELRRGGRKNFIITGSTRMARPRLEGRKRIPVETKKSQE